MTNQIWIYLALITLLLGLGALPKVERVVAPVNMEVLFK